MENRKNYGTDRYNRNQHKRPQGHKDRWYSNQESQDYTSSYGAPSHYQSRNYEYGNRDYNNAPYENRDRDTRTHDWSLMDQDRPFGQSSYGQSYGYGSGGPSYGSGNRDYWLRDSERHDSAWSVRSLDQGRVEMKPSYRSSSFSPDRQDYARGSRSDYSSYPSNQSYSPPSYDYDYLTDNYHADRNEGFFDSMKNSVKNFFGKGPKGYMRSDERIQEDVCDALYRHPRIDASEIEVEVNEGTVTLKGSVEDRQAKRMAEDIAESCTGVSNVSNQILVNKGSLGAQNSLLSTSARNQSAGATIATKTKSMQ